jgi:hypothetical protein
LSVFAIAATRPLQARTANHCDTAVQVANRSPVTGSCHWARLPLLTLFCPISLPTTAPNDLVRRVQLLSSGISSTTPILSSIAKSEEPQKIKAALRRDVACRSAVPFSICFLTRLTPRLDHRRRRRRHQPQSQAALLPAGLPSLDHQPSLLSSSPLAFATLPPKENL